jgi:small ligand-binding sensory domain FIST
LLAVPQTADQAPDKVSSAQALLVVDIADEFDYNAEALSLVNEKIDELALSGCAAERQSILAAVKMASLQEAVR